MLMKQHGRNRVHNVMAKAGYGVGGAARVARGEGGIPKALKSVERELRAEGGSVKHRMDRKPRASGGSSGIHIKPSHKGLLHKDLGISSDKPIPMKKLTKAEHSGDPAVRKRAVFAANAKKWNKK